MLALVLLCVGVPALALAARHVARRRLVALGTDMRGIALQTVIIMVVLLAIAGAIAAVLITRGNEAVTEVERTDVDIDPSTLSSEEFCEAAGFTWAANACS